MQDRGKRRQPNFKKAAKHEKGERLQALRFPKSTCITIPMDTMKLAEIQKIYKTFHNSKGVLESCPAQNGWENNRAFITKLSPNGRMTTLFQGFPDDDSYLGYGILFVNIAIWLNTVRKAPWDQVEWSILLDKYISRADIPIILTF